MKLDYFLLMMKLGGKCIVLLLASKINRNAILELKDNNLQIATSFNFWNFPRAHTDISNTSFLLFVYQGRF